MYISMYVKTWMVDALLLGFGLFFVLVYKWDIFLHDSPVTSVHPPYLSMRLPVDIWCSSAFFPGEK